MQVLCCGLSAREMEAMRGGFCFLPPVATDYVRLVFSPKSEITSTRLCGPRPPLVVSPRGVFFLVHSRAWRERLRFPRTFIIFPLCFALLVLVVFVPRTLPFVLTGNQYRARAFPWSTVLFFQQLFYFFERRPPLSLSLSLSYCSLLCRCFAYRAAQEDARDAAREKETMEEEKAAQDYAIA